jgi:hypothetical protein
MTDDELVAAVENGTLPQELFHHADHVKMAFLFLERYPLLEAIRHFSSSLARLATAYGKANLYNETITWAYLLLIRERLARAGRRQSWAEFAAANADLLDWHESILKKYYREETLNAEFARATFVFPDRIEARSARQAPSQST